MSQHHVISTERFVAIIELEILANTGYIKSPENNKYFVKLQNYFLSYVLKINQKVKNIDPNGSPREQHKIYVLSKFKAICLKYITETQSMIE